MFKFVFYVKIMKNMMIIKKNMINNIISQTKKKKDGRDINQSKPSFLFYSKTQISTTYSSLSNSAFFEASILSYSSFEPTTILS